MEVPTRFIRKTSTCSTLPSRAPDVATFTGLDDLGLRAVGQLPEPDKAVLAVVSSMMTAGADAAAATVAHATASCGTAVIELERDSVSWT